MIFRLRRPVLSLSILALVLLAGCIQPVEEEPTPAPTQPAAAAPAGDLAGDLGGAADEGAGAPLAVTPTLDSGVPENVAPPAADVTTLVSEFVQRRGDQPGNLAIWYDQPLGTDQMRAFTYTNAAGQPCAGFLLFATPAAASDNGALACAEDAAAGAFAGVTLFLNSAGQPYSIVFGQVFDPTISAVAAIYSDGTSAQTAPEQGGYQIVSPGVAEVSAVTAIDPAGNTVIPDIPRPAVR